MNATPFIKEEYDPSDLKGGFISEEGYKVVESDNIENELTKKNLLENTNTLKPYDFFRLGQQQKFYSPLKIKKSKMNGVSLNESELYTTTTTRFNGSQYGYRSTSGHNPRGATWFDVDNIMQPKEDKSKNLDEDTIQMIAQSSISGYQIPKTGYMGAEDRILAKSNDTFAPTFTRDAFRNQIIDPSGKQGERKYVIN